MSPDTHAARTAPNGWSPSAPAPEEPLKWGAPFPKGGGVP